MGGSSSDGNEPSMPGMGTLQQCGDCGRRQVGNGAQLNVIQEIEVAGAPLPEGTASYDDGRRRHCGIEPTEALCRQFDSLHRRHRVADIADQWYNVVATGRD